MTAQEYKAPSYLARLFGHLLAGARLNNRTHRMALAGGARVAVAVRDGLITVSISRHGVDVGAVEERTFRREFAIPDEAERIPAVGQGRRMLGHQTTTQGDHHYVAFRWKDGQ